MEKSEMLEIVENALKKVSTHMENNEVDPRDAAYSISELAILYVEINSKYDDALEEIEV